MTEDLEGAGVLTVEQLSQAAVYVKVCVVEVETSAPNQADAWDAKARAPKAKVILGCMAALNDSN